MSILVAYDGRDHTKKALDYAIRHSQAYNTPLYIFSVISSKDKLDGDGEINRVMDYLKEACDKAISEGVDAEYVLESGVPAKTILKAAERFNVEAIVVGRSDRTFFDRAVLGSVSDYMVRNANRTVIVVQ